MSTLLSVGKQLITTGWIITGRIESTELPDGIFLYENIGTNQLGNYLRVISPPELARIKLWDGNPITAFGNKTVRYSIATIYLTDDEVDPATVIMKLKNDVQRFSRDYKLQWNDTEVFSIT